MRQVRFHFRGRVIGSLVEEIVDFEDDATDEEIQECFTDWLYSNSDAGWEDVAP